MPIPCTECISRRPPHLNCHGYSVTWARSKPSFSLQSCPATSFQHDRSSIFRKSFFIPQKILSLGLHALPSGLESAILLQPGLWQGTSDRLAIAAFQPPIPMIRATENQDSTFLTNFPACETG